MEIIDIHSHIFPCVDDGASSYEMAIEMLKEEKRQGVTSVFFTPHSYAMNYTNKADRKKMNKTIERLKNDTGMELYLGCEVTSRPKMFSSIAREQNPTMNGSDYVLVEFRNPDHDEIHATHMKLEQRGYKMIIAHIERYGNVSMRHIEQLREEGCMFQVNAYSLLRETDQRIHTRALDILKNGMLDFIGSDAHDTYRRPVVIDAYAILDKYGYIDKARKLLIEKTELDR